MAYYIIDGNYNNYKFLSYIPFNTEKPALKYWDKNSIITSSSTTPTIHYKYDTLPVDSNGTIFKSSVPRILKWGHTRYKKLKVIDATTLITIVRNGLK